MKCPKKYGKQWKLKLGKLEWQKQKEEEEKVQQILKAKEQKIWDKEQKVANLEKEAKKLVSPRFYKQIYITINTS